MFFFSSSDQKCSALNLYLSWFADKESAEEMNNYFRPDALDAGRVEDLVKNYFADTDEVGFIGDGDYGLFYLTVLHPLIRFTAKRDYDFQMDQLVEHSHLKSSLPLCYMLCWLNLL